MIRETLLRAAMLGALVACGRAADGAGDGDLPNAGTGGMSGAGGASGSTDTSGAVPGSFEELTSPVAKVDLLLMVDNSVSMSDKQGILELAVPDIVSRLVNPICVDAMGNQYPPAPPGQPCPDGQAREFDAITDINVGVVSSSLGDAGANAACPGRGAQNYRADRVDMAHLVGSLERSTVQGDSAEGFLAWRAGSVDVDDFNADVQQMVRDVGEAGCGWESSLESWYRFLVDPAPYRELTRVPCPGSSSSAPNCVQPATDAEGRLQLDEVLLAQRAAFLRPDSLVVILMLTDENDCSIRVGNQSWVVTAVDDVQPMFRGSSTCASDPNAKCCHSCGLTPPEGCEADPICNADPASGALEDRLPPSQDGLNMRCFQQKRRFGVDFLYPTQRYVNALSQLELCWNAPDLSTDGCGADDIVQNPLYESWDRRQRVFLAGILGVPWQAIASPNDASGRPLSDPSRQLRFKSSAEMSAPGDDTWTRIAGSSGVPWQPASVAYPEVLGVPAVSPTLPQMVESEFPRSGIEAGNPINGREYDTLGPGTRGAPDDLQYACIFRLSAPRDCAQRDPNAGEACNCYEGSFDRPLCEESPGLSAAGTTEYFAKAYPGLRHLAVLEDYGENSIVASICARNVTDPTAPDFGYRPAAQAILERLNAELR